MHTHTCRNAFQLEEKHVCDYDKQIILLDITVTYITISNGTIISI